MIGGISGLSLGSTDVWQRRKRSPKQMFDMQAWRLDSRLQVFAAL
jgi:hypothetical protein